MDGIDRRSGLLAFAATLVLQSGLILWAGYLDIDRTAPEEAPISTAIRFVFAAAGPQPEAEPPPEKALEPVVEEVLPKPVVETPRPAPEPPKPKPVVKEKPEKLAPKKRIEKPKPKPVAEKPVKRIPKETPKEVVQKMPVTAKPTPPFESKPEPVRGASVAPQTASSAVSEAKTADALLAALASMIERHKKYPRAAQRAQLKGDVRVKVLVDSGGRLQSYNLIESSGHGILDKATLAIFKRIKGNRIAANEMERALEIVVPVRYVRQ